MSGTMAGIPHICIIRTLNCVTALNFIAEVCHDAYHAFYLKKHHWIQSITMSEGSVNPISSQLPFPSSIECATTQSSYFAYCITSCQKHVTQGYTAIC